MYLTVFASGSSGNCALVSQGDTHLLVDAGISAKNIRLGLARRGLCPEELSGVVITHNHSDHISGLRTLTRQLPSLPLFATVPVARQICYRLPAEGQTHTFQPGEDFSVGALRVRSIPTSHDTPGSVGYRFTAPDGRAACVVTDLGVVTPQVEAAVEGVDLAMIECNHDIDSLRNGPYPYYLKARIAGPQGHLSNTDGAGLCALCARSGARSLILAHLSRENNTPALARAAVSKALEGLPPVRLEVAPALCGGLTIEV